MSHPQPGDDANRTSLFPYKEWFALDIRSLALFRVLLALMVLLDWIDRVPDLRDHFSDEGVLPREILMGINPLSFHLFSGAVWFQYLLAGLAIVFALCLMIGFQTPLMCLFSFLMIVSAHGRNPSLLQGGDHLIRALLFWSIFLPLGAAWSLDARDPRDLPKSPVVLSVGTFALIGQLVIVYLFAAVWKWDDTWRKEASAVYITLQNESFTTRVGYLLREHVWLCKLLTQYTVYLETFGPVLLFLPFHVGLQRLIAIALFITFHAGLALCMELGNFPFIGMVAWTALIPSSFWDRLQSQLGLPAVLQTGEASRSSGWRPPSGRVSTVFLALAFLYVFVLNLNNFFATRQPDKPLFPGVYGQLGAVTGLEQGWGLFAPRPSPLAGWYLVIGTKTNGTQVEMLRNTSPPDKSKPKMYAQTFSNGRWRKLVQNMGAVQNYPYLTPGYLKWAIREWNASHGETDQLVKIEIIYMKQATVGPNEPDPPVEEVFILSYTPDEKPVFSPIQFVYQLIRFILSYTPNEKAGM